MLFGVPSRDLETTWFDVTQISTIPKAGQSPLLNERGIATIATTVSKIFKWFFFFLKVETPSSQLISLKASTEILTVIIFS